MKVIKTYRLAGLFACCSLAGTTGCSSVMSHTGPGQGYYPGTRASAAIITDDQTSWALKPLAVIDLPFSALMDTVLLPWDYMRSGDDKSVDSPRERVLRSEKLTHPEESMSGNAPVAANAMQP
ncbi:YceK/YidQ family lipoprotein [Pantoea sp. B65]|uniref:YceK/YidQ family lipoprotein n=1 Tax=Pantoea sp. B65 TaxID=2813359 RepID=UPI0039B5AD95